MTEEQIQEIALVFAEWTEQLGYAVSVAIIPEVIQAIDKSRASAPSDVIDLLREVAELKRYDPSSRKGYPSVSPNRSTLAMNVPKSLLERIDLAIAAIAPREKT